MYRHVYTMYIQPAKQQHTKGRTTYMLVLRPKSSARSAQAELGSTEVYITYGFQLWYFSSRLKCQSEANTKPLMFYKV